MASLPRRSIGDLACGSGINEATLRL